MCVCCVFVVFVFVSVNRSVCFFSFARMQGGAIRVLVSFVFALTIRIGILGRTERMRRRMRRIVAAILMTLCAACFVCFVFYYGNVRD